MARNPTHYSIAKNVGGPRLQPLPITAFSVVKLEWQLMGLYLYKIIFMCCILLKEGQNANSRYLDLFLLYE